MSRVLVTGGGGFLGSHLVERLEREGHDVVVPRRRDVDLTRYDDTARLFEESGIVPGAENMMAKLRYTMTERR